MRHSQLSLCGLLLAALFSISSLGAATFPVLNTNDVGADSLRKAITDANATSDPDVITFNIPPSDPNRNAATGDCTITAGSPLPTITNPVTIDGYSQPGAAVNTLNVGNNAVLLIELRGSSGSTSAIGSGLVLGGSNGGSTVRGLVINRFGVDFYDAGVLLASGNNVVEGNFIGTDPTGNNKVPNVCGVRVGTGANNLIGGTVPAARNVISGNNSNTANIAIEPRFGSGEPAPTGTLIRGNYIGTNAGGTAAVETGSFAPRGVIVAAGSGIIIGGTDGDDGAVDGSVGARNVIAGNTDGIHTTETSLTLPVGLTVQGNFIGVDATGVTVLRNTGYGIFFGPPRDRSDSILNLGGTAPGAGNVISGNTNVGVYVVNSNLVMQGNRIGTDFSGTLDLGNASHGVELTRGGSPPFPLVQFTVGGATPGAGNIISANSGYGIRIFNPTSATTVQGNLIGTQADGVSSLGNRLNGLFVQTTATIGGTTAGARNVVAFNYLGPTSFGLAPGGILLSTEQFPVPTGVAILGNSVFGNGGLGITFGGGVTPQANDSGDGDTGPNNRQNFPLLTSARATPNGLSVRGTLNSQPNATYRIEFFGNSEIDPALHGEGRTFLGFTEVTTDAVGNAAFDAPTAVGSIITSTATDAAGNTSEFSQAIGQLLNISTRLRVRTGENVLIAGYIVTGSDPKRILVRGIGPSLASRGIGDGLQDPTLELFDGNGDLLAENDNWKDSQQAEIEATTIPPTDEREPAIVRTLPAGNSAYTAVVRGKDETVGTAVVEAYDLDQAASSKLANISTRGFVETGNNVLIGGFIAGNGVVKVLVRALGPSLSSAGVANPLQDPILDLRDGSGTIALSNDNWRSSQEAEISATTIPPPNESEAAIVATLPPAPYTAVVRGKNDTTGIALVEVYALD